MKVMNPEFDSRIADWLEDDPDKAPSIVLETVVGALESIPQRRTWRSLLRTNQMPRFSIAAGLLLVAAVGVSAWIAGNRGGIGSVPPTPAPTVAPTPEPTQVAAASPRILTGVNQGLPVPAGTWQVESPFEAPFLVTISGSYWGVGILEHNVLTLDREDGNRSVGSLAVTRPNKVYEDPCHTESGPVEFSGVDELVAALTSMPGFTAGPISDVSINGVEGKFFTLDNSIEVGEPACPNGLKIATYDRFGMNDAIFASPGEQERYWVLDVNGQPVMLQLLVAETATSEEQSETDRTIQSIDFD